MLSSYLINEFETTIQTEVNFLSILLPFQLVSFVWPLFPILSKENVKLWSAHVDVLENTSVLRETHSFWGSLKKWILERIHIKMSLSYHYKSVRLFLYPMEQYI